MNRTVPGSCLRLLLALLLSVPFIAQAAESYDNCTGFITSLPTTISTQGTWCLKQDLATNITSGVAITIATNNVTIDCNDFKLGGLAAGAATTTIGIYALNHLNASVRHCNIRGFRYGLYFDGVNGGGHAVEDNRFDGNTWVGLRVEGDGSVVQRNRVFDTGGSSVLADAYGVVTLYSVDILNNTVSGVAATPSAGGSATGIFTAGNASGRIIGNGVNGVAKDGSGLAKGISNGGSDRIALRKNDVVGDGSSGSVGISCSSANGNAMDNVISDFVTALVSCTDSGGNVVVP